MLTIRTRLFLAFLFVVGVGFVLLADWVGDDLRPRYLEAVEESMLDTATLLSSLLAAGVVEGEIEVEDLRADQPADNRAAQALYRRAGFRPDQLENYFPSWQGFPPPLRLPVLLQPDRRQSTA